MGLLEIVWFYIKVIYYCCYLYMTTLFAHDILEAYWSPTLFVINTFIFILLSIFEGDHIVQTVGP